MDQEERIDIFEIGKTDSNFESPIDVNFDILKPLTLPPLVWKNVDEEPRLMKLTNSGHSVILSAKWFGPRPFVTGGPLTGLYVFSQLHFHWGKTDKEGSEHTINGTRMPMELHVMFFNSKYLSQEEAMTHLDGIIIFSYLFNITKEPNPHLSPIVKALKKIQRPHTSEPTALLPITRFFPPFTKDYFLYWGKVSDDHKILWFLGREILHVGSEQLAAFRTVQDVNKKAMSSNFRDTRPLNGRTVFHVNPGLNLETPFISTRPDSRHGGQLAPHEKGGMGKARKSQTGVGPSRKKSMRTPGGASDAVVPHMTRTRREEYRSNDEISTETQETTSSSNMVSYTSLIQPKTEFETSVLTAINNTRLAMCGYQFRPSRSTGSDESADSPPRVEQQMRHLKERAEMMYSRKLFPEEDPSSDDQSPTILNRLLAYAKTRGSREHSNAEEYLITAIQDLLIEGREESEDTVQGQESLDIAGANEYLKDLDWLPFCSSDSLEAHLSDPHLEEVDLRNGAGEEPLHSRYRHSPKSSAKKEDREIGGKQSRDRKFDAKNHRSPSPQAYIMTEEQLLRSSRRQARDSEDKNVRVRRPRTPLPYKMRQDKLQVEPGKSQSKSEDHNQSSYLAEQSKKQTRINEKIRARTQHSRSPPTYAREDRPELEPGKKTDHEDRSFRVEGSRSPRNLNVLQERPELESCKKQARGGDGEVSTHPRSSQIHKTRGRSPESTLPPKTSKTNEDQEIRTIQRSPQRIHKMKEEVPLLKSPEKISKTLHRSQFRTANSTVPIEEQPYSNSKNHDRKDAKKRDKRKESKHKSHKKTQEATGDPNQSWKTVGSVKVLITRAMTKRRTRKLLRKRKDQKEPKNEIAAEKIVSQMAGTDDQMKIYVVTLNESTTTDNPTDKVSNTKDETNTPDTSDLCLRKSVSMLRLTTDFYSSADKSCGDFSSGQTSSSNKKTESVTPSEEVDPGQFEKSQVTNEHQSQVQSKAQTKRDKGIQVTGLEFPYATLIHRFTSEKMTQASTNADGELMSDGERTLHQKIQTKSMRKSSNLRENPVMGYFTSSSDIPVAQQTRVADWVGPTLQASVKQLEEEWTTVGKMEASEWSSRSEKAVPHLHLDQPRSEARNGVVVYCPVVCTSVVPPVAKGFEAAWTVPMETETIAVKPSSPSPSIITKSTSQLHDVNSGSLFMDQMRLRPFLRNSEETWIIPEEPEILSKMSSSRDNATLCSRDCEHDWKVDNKARIILSSKPSLLQEAADVYLSAKHRNDKCNETRAQDTSSTATTHTASRFPRYKISRLEERNDRWPKIPGPRGTSNTNCNERLREIDFVRPVAEQHQLKSRGPTRLTETRISKGLHNSEKVYVQSMDDSRLRRTHVPISTIREVASSRSLPKEQKTECKVRPSSAQPQNSRAEILKSRKTVNNSRTRILPPKEFDYTKMFCGNSLPPQSRKNELSKEFNLEQPATSFFIPFLQGNQAVTRVVDSEYIEPSVDGETQTSEPFYRSVLSFTIPRPVHVLSQRNRLQAKGPPALLGLRRKRRVKTVQIDDNTESDNSADSPIPDNFPIMFRTNPTTGMPEPQIRNRSPGHPTAYCFKTDSSTNTDPAMVPVINKIQASPRCSKKKIKRATNTIRKSFNRQTMITQIFTGKKSVETQMDGMGVRGTWISCEEQGKEKPAWKY